MIPKKEDVDVTCQLKYTVKIAHVQKRNGSMSLLSNFDTNENFWENNPTLKVAGPFKDLYTKDKSRNKAVSSKLMWAVALIWDRSSKFYNQPEDGPDGKIALIFEDYYGDPEYYSKNKDKVNELRDFYRKLQESHAERTLRGIEEKLEERDTFLKETSYTMGIEGERGFMYGTVDTLDRMMSNTKKLYDMWEEARKLVTQEKEKGQTMGGGQESLTDADEI